VAALSGDPAMRILVTGASSLIGSGLARTLAARGDQVVCFQRRNVDDLVGIDRVEQYLGDVRDAEALTAAAADCDAIIHLAARVGVVGSAEDFQSVNVGGTRNAIAAAQFHGIARFVQVSSPSVAHGGEAIIGADADEPTTGRTRAWYAETKALAEIDALAAASPELGVVAIRPHLVWGPGDTQLVGRIVGRARQGKLALVGGGRALVDTTYIDNAVDALIAAVDRIAPGAACSGRAYVIANGEPRPIRDLVAGICAAANVPFEPHNVALPAARTVGSILERVWPRLPSRLRDGEAEPPLTRFVAEQLGTAHWFDPRPAAADLGWVPQVSIDDGLDRLADWFSEHND
jgi:nucleoside-diphosphate-sugar epimerase